METKIQPGEIYFVNRSPHTEIAAQRVRAGEQLSVALRDVLGTEQASKVVADLVDMDLTVRVFAQ